MMSNGRSVRWPKTPARRGEGPRQTEGIPRYRIRFRNHRLYPHQHRHRRHRRLAAPQSLRRNSHERKHIDRQPHRGRCVMANGTGTTGSLVALVILGGLLECMIATSRTKVSQRTCSITSSTRFRRARAGFRAKTRPAGQADGRIIWHRKHQTDARSLPRERGAVRSSL